MTLEDEDELELVSSEFKVSKMSQIKQLWADTCPDANVISGWHQVVEVSVNCSEDTITIQHNGLEIDMPKHKLAVNNPFKKFDRVVAFRRSEDMPYKIDDTGELVKLYPNTSDRPYAGLVVEFSGNDESTQCLVFFDDGHVQAVKRRHIFKVLETNWMSHGKQSLARLYLVWLCLLIFRQKCCLL